MERIARALELARIQRGTPPGHMRLEALAGPAVSDTDTDTRDAPFCTVAMQVAAQRFERERILAAGAPGPAGRPYKLLRTQVLQRLQQLGASTLAVLSPAAAEGKTLTAINLAIAISAELGRSALLVDLDLRKPSVAERLGIRPDVGVEECLQGARPLRDAFVRLAGYDRLALLLAGRTVENSSELIGSRAAAALVEELRQRHPDRVVIFDLPPVLQADDALAFAPLVQAGLLVAAEGRTVRTDLKRTMELLHRLPIVGAVLNASRSASGQYY